MEPVYKNLGKVRPTIDDNNWSINNKYDLLTIVYDPSSNKSYISRKDVPANIVIDNREYWLPFGVGRFVDNAIININYLDGVSQELVTYTLKEAIARIGNEDKRLGVIISFYGNEASDSHTPGWCLYQFMSNDLNDWDNVNAWNSIYYNRNKNVGWFRTEGELLTIYPSPHKGDYCYIGISLINSFVYRCYENGTWINTHELASANIGIIVGGNICISENGTWIVDDKDTGIKAVGTGIERMTYTPSQEDGGINVLQVKLTDGTQFSFPIKNGNQGNSGIIVPDLEIFLAELVNNLTTDDATKALSAAQGVILNNKISQLGQQMIYDVTMNNSNHPTFASLLALLSDANLSTLIPANVRCGGMSIRFVQTSDNKYVQFRCKTQSFSTNPDDWYFDGDNTLIENPEFIEAKTDADGKLLAARKLDGTKVEYLNLEVKGDIINEGLQNNLDSKVNAEEGKSLVNSSYASSQSTIENPEWLSVTTDPSGRILEGITSEGKKKIMTEALIDGVSIKELSDKVKALDNKVKDRNKLLYYQENYLVCSQWNVGQFGHGAGNTTITPANYNQMTPRWNKDVKNQFAHVFGLIEYNPVFAKNPDNVDISPDDVVWNEYTYKEVQRQPPVNIYYGGNAINSKYPLSTSTKVKYRCLEGVVAPDPDTQNFIDNVAFYTLTEMTYMGVKVKIAECTVPFNFENHLDNTYQSLVYEELAETFKNEPFVIIMGDFELVRADDYDIFKNRGYNLANGGEFGWFPTCPSPLVTGVYALDNIIVKGFDIIDVVISHSELSDHYPLIATLEISSN